MATPEKVGTPLELTFEGCIQDAEELGSGRDQMVSRVFFWIRRDGGPQGDFRSDLERVSGEHFAKLRIEAPAEYTGPMLYADLRQNVGDDFEMGGIEVGPAVGYRGPIPQAEFSREAAAYFRGVMSAAGAMVRVEQGRPVRGGLRPTAHVRLRHNVEASRRTVRLEARPPSAAR
jgi:hypothetical protein